MSAFGVAALGGLAALLRGKEDLNLRSVLSSILYSGIIGLIVALMWYNYFEGKGNIPFLLAVSGLAGIGGATALDLMKIFFQGKINLHIEPVPDESEEDDEPNDDT